MTSPMFKSAIFPGHVSHARLKPTKHAFTYPVYYYAVDLDQLHSLDQEIRFFGYNRFNIVSLHDKDYLGTESGSIKEKLFKLLTQNGVNCEDIAQVILVTTARFFYYTFNPISFYFCYNKNNALIDVVLEVNNTYKEKHIYRLASPLKASSNSFNLSHFTKAFHVSPFYDVHGEYQVKLSDLHDSLNIQLDLYKNNQCVFQSGLRSTKRLPMNHKSILKVILAYPINTWLTVPRIYLQAAKLYFVKKLPFNYLPKPISPMTIRSPSHAATPPKKGISMSLSMFAINLAEKGWVPDCLTMRGMDWVVSNWTKHLNEHGQELKRTTVELMRKEPIAIQTQAANAQHYEVPAAFFQKILGKHKKYSCCYWGDNLNTKNFNPQGLDRAEEDMLNLYCTRAQLVDGMQILDLGCGWGALSLWIAKKYPKSKILALSNSKSQGEYILSQAKKASLTNLEVVTANIEDFQTDKKFDRILSIEMFEHMRNWELLFNKLYPLLKTNGKVFLHFFSNSLAAYPFEDRGPSDWMARTFFTGGLMPSEDIFNYLNTPFKLVEQWRIDGRHYALTLNAWLYRMDQNKQEILDLFKNVYGDQATIWFNRWRMFLMGCDSYFNFRNGETSGVTHLLLKRDVDS